MNSCILVGGYLVCDNAWECDFIDEDEKGKCKYCLLNTYCTNEDAKSDMVKRKQMERKHYTVVEY